MPKDRNFFEDVRHFFAMKRAEEAPVRKYKSTVIRDGDHVLVGHGKPLAKDFKATHESRIHMKRAAF